MRTRGKPHRRALGRITAVVCLAGAGLAAGLALRGVVKPPAPDYQVRKGRYRFTNPLMECEVAGYRRGKELRPFKTEIETLIATLVRHGTVDRVSLYFRDLDNGPWFGIRENETYTPASLLKVPTILAAFAQAERDPTFLAREVRFEGFPGEQIRGLFEPEDRLVRGRRYTIAELIRRATAYSDNGAIALIGRQVDTGVLVRLLDDLGLPPELADLKAQAALSPRVYGQLFRVLYNAGYLGREMSDRALGSFAASTFREGLVAGLPTGTVVAHKFGIWAPPGKSGPDQLHDCGIVYHEQRPYFLCVMTEGHDVNLLAEGIGEISRAVYEAVDIRTIGIRPGEEALPLFTP